MRIVWHDFAWIGPESRQAAQAARCAGKQDRFWEYHDHLFQNQRGENRGQFSAANLKAFAGTLGLDAPTFGSCLDEAAGIPAIQLDLTIARQGGINATPSFALNGQRLVGALSVSALVRAIDAEVARSGG